MKKWWRERIKYRIGVTQQNNVRFYMNLDCSFDCVFLIDGVILAVTHSLRREDCVYNGHGYWASYLT